MANKCKGCEFSNFKEPATVCLECKGDPSEAFERYIKPKTITIPIGKGQTRTVVIDKGAAVRMNATYGYRGGLP
jgi:hypothetical protein